MKQVKGIDRCSLVICVFGFLNEVRDTIDKIKNKRNWIFIQYRIKGLQIRKKNRNQRIMGCFYKKKKVKRKKYQKIDKEQKKRNDDHTIQNFKTLFP